MVHESYNHRRAVWGAQARRVTHRSDDLLPVALCSQLGNLVHGTETTCADDTTAFIATTRENEAGPTSLPSKKAGHVLSTS